MYVKQSRRFDLALTCRSVLTGRSSGGGACTLVALGGSDTLDPASTSLEGEVTPAIIQMNRGICKQRRQQHKEENEENEQRKEHPFTEERVKRSVTGEGASIQNNRNTV